MGKYVPAFFMMLRDGKQGWRGGGGGEWYFMKGRNVTVNNHKAVFCTIVKRLGFH